MAAELLAELVGPDDVLGVAWSRSVGAMARALPRLAAVPVVQLTGAITMPDGDEGSIDIVRDVARAAGGPAYVFYAPFTLPDAATATTLRNQREVALTLGQLPNGDEGGRRHRGLGARAVDALRHRPRARAPRAAAARRLRGGLRGLPVRRRGARADRTDRSE